MGIKGKSGRSGGSAGSILSIGSSGSILSIGSSGSILSIGSAGSVLSIGSVASFACICSVGSFASAGSILSALSRQSILAWRSAGGPDARWCHGDRAADPPLAPDELVAAGTERVVLEAFLDFHRDVLVRKVSGVSELEARHRRVPSKTTLAGLVKHMTGVERGWFQRVLAGGPRPRSAPTSAAATTAGNSPTARLSRRWSETTGAPAKSRGRPPRGSLSTTPCRSGGWAGCRCAGSTST